MTRIPLPRLLVRDAAALERRARALADAGSAERAEATEPFVAFRLGGHPCAVRAEVVSRAVVALARPVLVPLAGGGERAVAFVDERPLSVVDLAGFAAGGARGADALAGVPALVVDGGAAPVAVAVEGPLELVEDRVAARAPEPAGGGVRIAAVLASGAALVDGRWLAALAAGTATP